MGDKYKVTEKLFDKLSEKDSKENKEHEVIDKLSPPKKKKKINNAFYKMASEEE